ncbi:MAG: TonB-dependent receptor, partial [Bacteroidales bacterium]|nr:TonB-dependent receptor [Bacteroidales bacterium]
EANGSTSLSENTSWVMDYILTYARDFGEHSINASLVYTRDSDKTVTQSYSGKDFTDAGNTIMGWYGLGDAAVQTVKSPSYVLHTDVGYLVRAIYAYRDTYHINVSFRRDGSSVFGKNHKWGSFPAVGGAWTMSNEPFMQNATWLNLLKLKLSWGMNGAQTLSPYGTLSTIKLAKSGGIAAYYDGQVHWGQTISTLGNPDLGWQTTTSWNGGFEAEFLKRRIAIEANVYKSKTTEQIFDRNIPIMNTGITKQKATMGRVDNWGVEINLNTVNVKQRKFRWESDVVFTLNRNKLVDLYGDGQDDITSSLFIGKSLGAIYGYRVSRIDTETGFPIYFDADGNETDNPAATDRTILGYKMENFRINFSNTFTWGNLQLYIMLSGIFGGNGYGLGDNTFAYSTYNTGTGFSAYDIPFWTPYNKSSVYPSPQFTNPSRFYAVYNSYGHVRLQDVSLSYNIAPHLTKIGISGAKISVSGRNLFYIAPKWKMSDPEARSDSSVSLPRAVTIALNLTF